ncbi:MAG: diaminopimelate decarboxylase [Saprospirales bacterium]|nr:diaminopimelate decarboxylase [Saprospirales bacterium]
MKLHSDHYEFPGGIDPLTLTEKYGSPLYVYEGETIERQYRRLAGAFSVPRLRIHYACKALTNISVLRFIRRLGAGLDTVSIQEVHLGLRAGFKPEEILYTPNCVSMEEIGMAVELGVHINIDNLSILEVFGHEYPNVPVCIRINPHIMAGGHTKTSVGHIDSKFGISIHQLPHLLKIVEATGQVVEGMHMHTGSDILDADIFLNAAEILLATAMNFSELRYIDFGRGCKVPYVEGVISPDIEELGARLSSRFNAFCQEYGRDLDLLFEPGKFLVSEAGHFLVKTNVIKTTPSTLFAGIDSGLNHLIRPMFYDAHHEILNVSRPLGKPRIYTVVGYICETDTFGSNRKIAEIQEGDVLCLKNAGAYCFSMSSNYNSRYRPAEVFLYQGKDHLIRQRETLEDLLRNQIEITSF